MTSMVLSNLKTEAGILMRTGFDGFEANSYFMGSLMPYGWIRAASNSNFFQ